MSTPHNSAEKGQIAKVVLMPGDPLRAQYVAENYLEDLVCFNSVRNMFGYTGTYKGTRLSVMGSGMGVPSMGIYSHELYHEYDVDTIIRIGTAGGLAPDVKLRQLVLAMATCTDSNYPAQLGLPGTFAPIADFGLLRKAAEIAEELGVDYRAGNLLTTDTFYCSEEVHRAWAQAGVLAAEMETAGLYTNALAAHKKALAIMTISDCPLTGEGLSAEERQTSFTQMMEVALRLAVATSKE